MLEDLRVLVEFSHAGLNAGAADHSASLMPVCAQRYESPGIWQRTRAPSAGPQADRDVSYAQA